MPIYEYECEKCGSFEHSQSINDKPLARCPKCRRKVQRLISASSFHLKGGGWYSDGYQGKSSGSGDSKKKGSEKTEKKAETTSTPAAEKKSSAGSDGAS